MNTARTPSAVCQLIHTRPARRVTHDCCPHAHDERVHDRQERLPTGRPQLAAVHVDPEPTADAIYPVISINRAYGQEQKKKTKKNLTCKPAHEQRALLQSVGAEAK